MKTEGQRLLFIQHLKDMKVISMEEYLLLMSLARGTRPSVSVHFGAYIDRMCAERPELAIAMRAKQRILRGTKP
jgi:hypothetical protein